MRAHHFIIFSFLALFLTLNPAQSMASGDAAKGKWLFDEIKCKRCHSLTERPKIGPGLKGITQRRSQEWLVKWLKDPQATWEENDEETQKMRQWREDRAGDRKTRMKIPPLGETDAINIIAYMKQNDES